MYSFKIKSRKIRNLRETYIEVKKSDTLITTGSSKQFVGDQDNKALGQKYALKNALKDTIIPKTRRDDIWNDFFNRSNALKKLRNK